MIYLSLSTKQRTLRARHSALTLQDNPNAGIKKHKELKKHKTPKTHFALIALFAHIFSHRPSRNLRTANQKKENSKSTNPARLQPIPIERRGRFFPFDHAAADLVRIVRLVRTISTNVGQHVGKAKKRVNVSSPTRILSKHFTTLLRRVPMAKFLGFAPDFKRVALCPGVTDLPVPRRVPTLTDFVARTVE
jgi:hypothetical protein